MIPLVIGTLLAMSGLAFVLWPIFVAELGEPVQATQASRVRAPRPIIGDDPIVALREIEFDRETGKLSDSDYATLKAEFTRRAVSQLRNADAGTAPAEEAAERAIRLAAERMKGCATCGPRPETDAVFCSSCGRYLAATCASCGSHITEADARYCSTCGYSLAA